MTASRRDASQPRPRLRSDVRYVHGDSTDERVFLVVVAHVLSSIRREGCLLLFLGDEHMNEYRHPSPPCGTEGSGRAKPVTT